MSDLQIEYIEIEKLKHFENNSKIHTKEQINHIANSISEFGFNDPIGIAGKENIDKAYKIAVEERYRFFSFGDAMFIQ